MGLVAWNIAIVGTVWRLRREIDSIHAVDLDSALTAYLAGALLRIPVIVDFYDSYPDSRGLRNTAARAARKLEGLLAAKAALTIIADPTRRGQHGIREGANLLVVENVPALAWAADPVDADEPLTLGYLGNLEAWHRGLEDVLEIVASDPRYRLVVAGAGALEGRIRLAAATCERIVFHGAVEHRAGMALMARCHVILGLYYLSVENHRFAAPNKYYEHLVLGRPLLTSRGTPPGAKVEAQRTGWAVDDGARSIRGQLEILAADRNAIVAAGRRARAVWDESFASYVEANIHGLYVLRSAAAARKSA
nr:hypothetical protein [Novosphingobium sp. Gsoil 351]